MSIDDRVEEVNKATGCNHHYLVYIGMQQTKQTINGMLPMGNCTYCNSSLIANERYTPIGVRFEDHYSHYKRLEKTIGQILRQKV